MIDLLSRQYHNSNNVRGSGTYTKQEHAQKQIINFPLIIHFSPRESIILIILECRPSFRAVLHQLRHTNNDAMASQQRRRTGV